MWPFLFGLGGWTALLVWGWVQVGRSLGGPIRDEAAGTAPEGNKERDSDNVIPTTHYD